jgi:hypothetical protein
LWLDDGSDIFIQLPEFLLPDFVSSLENDPAIPLHVDDYDVPSTINVSEFQFPLPLILIIPLLQILMSLQLILKHFPMSLILILLLVISVKNLDFLKLMDLN